MSSPILKPRLRLLSRCTFAKKGLVVLSLTIYPVRLNMLLVALALGQHSPITETPVLLNALSQRHRWKPKSNTAAALFPLSAVPVHLRLRK